MATIISPILSLNELFCLVSSKINDGTKLENLQCALDSYCGNDWTEHVEFSDEKYSRKKIFANDLCELIVISWKNGQHTQIHDHPEGGCCMKVMLGLLFEDKYSENADIHLNTLCLDEKRVSYSEGKQVLHQIKALANSVSIHIYAPPGYKPNYYL